MVNVVHDVFVDEPWTDWVDIPSLTGVGVTCTLDTSVTNVDDLLSTPFTIVAEEVTGVE